MDIQLELELLKQEIIEAKKEKDLSKHDLLLEQYHKLKQSFNEE